MKRFLAILCAAVLFCGSAAAETVTEPETETEAETAAEPETEAGQLEMKTFPFYLYSPEETWPEEFPLYFKDGVYDLPFVELSDWAQVLNWLYVNRGDGLFNDYQVSVEVNPEANQVIYTRENSYFVLFDFAQGIVVWDDYVGFKQETAASYMDIAGIPTTDGEGRPFLLHNVDGRYLAGQSTVLNLADRNIPMIARDGKYLLPLQTLSAYFLSPAQSAVYYNQEVMFVNHVSAMKDPQQSLLTLLQQSGLLTQELITEINEAGGEAEEKMQLLFQKIMESEEGMAIILNFQESMSQSLYPIYAAGPKTGRSQELIEYGLNELCLELDSFYGLKDAHNISEFASFFVQTSLFDELLDSNAAKADSAIAQLTQYWLDDLHSAFNGPSYLAETNPIEGVSLGYSTQSFSSLYGVLGQYRALHPEAAPGYYEVGNTAYVTFDQFMFGDESGEIIDYYELAENGQLPDDTIGLIIKAHQQITRENSPIENVVLDLSCNGGGAAPTAVYVLGWFLGNAQVSVHDSFTGAESTMVYQADVNLDRQFDENDTISNLNLYCLISPLSFSCGNLVPWAFKEDGRVTLIGRTSGGGSCVVQPMTSAWGTSYQISGSMRISFVKNGAYYDVDRGVDPDFIINDYDHFYNREALTEYINGLY